MAIENIPINSGTGPSIAVDSVGTDNYQVVKFSTAGDGTGGGLFSGTMPVTVSSITGTQTVSVVNITTGTVSVTNVLSASGVTIANITTGTVTGLPTGTQDVNVVDKTAFQLAATTAGIGAVVSTAHASAFNGFAVNTTSGSSVILQTSGAHTLYVTDLMISADVPARVDIFSAATTKASVYLASKGGFVFPLKTPMILNSNQSLTFQPSASGSFSGFAAGYTVT